MIGIVLVPVYIEYLGMEAYGLIGIFGVLQAWLVLVDLGLRPALGREMARFTAGAHSAEWIRDLLRSVEVVGIALSAAVFLGVAFGSPWLAENWVTSKTLSTSMVIQAFTAMGFVTALRFVENIYTSSLTGLQRQVQENLVSSTAAVIRGVGAIVVLAFISPTITAFFVWQAIVSISTVIWLALLVYRALPKISRAARFAWETLKGVWRFAVGMMLLTVQSLLLTNLDKVVLSRLLTLEEFGRYALAGVAANVMGLLSAPVASALSPRFTELGTRNDEVELAKTYHLGSQLVATLTGSAAVVLVVFTERVLFLWTKNADIAGPLTPIARALILGSLFNALMYVPYQLQLAHGWTSLSTRFNFVLIALVVPSLLFVVPRFGAFGAAVLWASLTSTYLVVAIPVQHRRLLRGEMAAWYLDDTLRPIAVALGVAIAFRVLVPVWPSRLAELLTIGLISAITLAASAFSSRLIRPVLFAAWSRLRSRSAATSA